MADFFEIDFLDVESEKSGDAIALRYEADGTTRIHIVDGGFSDTGNSLVKHVNEYYGNPTKINHVVVTHPDQDHACGIKAVLEGFHVEALWMLRPWIYAAELLGQFHRFQSAASLAESLKEIYPYIAEVEEIALSKRIAIYEPFQGAIIGAFHVLAPSRARYLDLVVKSEKTPQAIQSRNLSEQFARAFSAVARYLRSIWGEEVFPEDGTSNENEMSVIQYATLCGGKILLTGDTGRSGLGEAADYAPIAGLLLPGIDFFQVPHHGGRRNVSTDLLDRWLGKRLPKKPDAGNETFTAIISAAKKDADHPRKAVVRAMIHRGAQVVGTKAGNLVCPGGNAPGRGWSPATQMGYPEDQEE